MKTFPLFALLLCALLACSCKKDNPFEQYEGSWSGTYSGEDTGTWTTQIDDNGTINGTVTSDSIPSLPFTLTGTLTEEGVLEAQAAVFIGSIAFKGQLSATGATGTWRNAAAEIEGTWTGAKE